MNYISGPVTTSGLWNDGSQISHKDQVEPKNEMSVLNVTDDLTDI